MATTTILLSSLALALALAMLATDRAVGAYDRELHEAVAQHERRAARRLARFRIRRPPRSAQGRA